MTNCPCCSGLSYDECCAPLIQQQTSAKTPEQLMRSRYTAYNQANINYIANTVRGKAALGFNPVASKQWATEVKWLALTVLRSFMKDQTTGFVEFVARYQENNQIHLIHELSEFHLIADRWYYIDGELRPKPNRNEPCPCGSHKKFKRCCGA